MLLSTYYGEKDRELKDANRGKVAAARILDISKEEERQGGSRAATR